MNAPRSATHEYDLIVLGGGAGGLSAARAGIRRGVRTLLVSEGPLGGDCTFTGCVPSKTLIEAAGAGRSFTEAMAAVHDAVERIAATETDAVLAGEGVEVHHGRARFNGTRRLQIDGVSLSARAVVVATGSRPAIPPIPGLEKVQFLTNETVFDLARQPASLAILGGGPIGCELAQAFARLGTRVTLIEALARVLARDEPEASEVAARVLRADGVTVCLGTKVMSAERSGTGAVVLRLRDGRTVEAERLLVAVGRHAATEGLDPEAGGVALDERGYVRTDARLATTAKGVWAVGDVAGTLAFTHAADDMGRIAVHNALSKLPDRRFHPEWTPWVTFIDPEVAHVGMSEAEAAGHGGRIAYLPMVEVDRAVTAGRTEGFIKLVVGPRLWSRNLAGGRLLGATVVAARAGELISELTLALRWRMFPARLALTTHPYPTWSTAIQKVAAQLFMDVEGRRARPAEPA